MPVRPFGTAHIFDKYDGFDNLKSLQIMSRAEIIEPFSDSERIDSVKKEIRKIPGEVSLCVGMSIMIKRMIGR